MPLRRAIWLNPALVALDQYRFAVGYKHHLDHVDTNPGETTIFYRYRARAKSGDQEGLAWEWGEDFKLAVQKSGKIIIAEPEWDGGKLLEVGYMDCGGGKLLIEVRPSPVERIKIGSDPQRVDQAWTPEGYADPEHIWNHPNLRS